MDHTISDNGTWKIDAESNGVINLYSAVGPASVSIPNGQCSFPKNGTIKTGLLDGQIVLNKQ